MPNRSATLPMEETETVQPVKDVALVPAEDTSLLATFERLARDPSVDVDKFERLMQMRERERARFAQEQFNAAMSKAQKAMRAIAADSWNPQTKSRYASYEALDAELRPIYTDHGFGLSFDTGDTTLQEHVRVLCLATHEGGHSREYHLDMPADGKGAKGGDFMTKTHATASAVTYGQRYLLKMIFNVAIKEGDDDGNGAAGKAAPPLPKEYEKWWTSLQAAAEKGLKSFDPAWECSEGVFKNYANTYHRDEVNALKKTAAGKR